MLNAVALAAFIVSSATAVALRRRGRGRRLVTPATRSDPANLPERNTGPRA